MSTDDWSRELDEAAKAFDDTCWKNSDNFSVLRGVCNDEIFYESFSSGARWAHARAQAEILRISESGMHALAGKTQFESLYEAERATSARLREIVEKARKVVRMWANGEYPGSALIDLEEALTPTAPNDGGRE